MTAAITFKIFALVYGQASITVQAHREPPATLSADIRGSMGSGGVRASVSDARLDFWFVKVLPLKSSGTTSRAAVEEGTPLGVVRLASEFRDIRGRLLKPGVSTLRFGLQPQNGGIVLVGPVDG